MNNRASYFRKSLNFLCLVVDAIVVKPRIQLIPDGRSMYVFVTFIFKDRQQQKRKVLSHANGFLAFDCDINFCNFINKRQNIACLCLDLC